MVRLLVRPPWLPRRLRRRGAPSRPPPGRGDPRADRGDRRHPRPPRPDREARRARSARRRRGARGAEPARRHPLGSAGPRRVAAPRRRGIPPGLLLHHGRDRPPGERRRLAPRLRAPAARRGAARVGARALRPRASPRARGTRRQGAARAARRAAAAARGARRRRSHLPGAPRAPRQRGRGGAERWRSGARGRGGRRRGRDRGRRLRPRRAARAARPHLRAFLHHAPARDGPGPRRRAPDRRGARRADRGRRADGRRGALHAAPPGRGMSARVLIVDDEARMAEVIAAALRRAGHPRGVASRYAPGAVVAESSGSRELLALVRRVAPSRATVLIQGESGTGKELVARLLHYWSDRVGRPFVAVNVKAFAEGVLESELFGHEKGAFTGAVAARAGCFERADGGTLFLDEIAEIAPDVQVKLLRVLQEGEVLRVGGGEARAVDVRVVAATNRVVREEIAAGRFREDLYFRLNVIPIQLLPLRSRREDIVPLARLFLARHAADAGRRLAFSPEAEAVLAAHGWPGNGRALANAVERAVALARGDTIVPEDLLLEERVGAGPAADGTLQDALDRAAATRIRAALDGAGGQRAEAARALGIDRTTLYRMMKRLGL